MFKKISAILLTVIMIIGTFCMLGCGGGEEESTTVELTPQQQIEQSEFLYPDKTEDFRYAKYTYYVIITQCLSLKSNIIVPDTIAGLPVYKIAAGAFKDQLTVTSISISDNVLTIGENAFYGCTNLQEVKLSKNLTTLGASAFANSGVKHLEFPNTLLEIPASVCASCANLTYVIIDEADITGTNEETGETITTGARTIGSGAFTTCASLRYMWIPEDATFTDTNVGTVNENIVIYGYSKSSAAILANTSLVDFHLVQSKAEMTEFKNKAELASDVVTLQGSENYKGSLINIQIEKTYIIREKVNYTTSYQDDKNETVTNSFEYEPETGCNLVLFGIKVTNNSAQKISFNELSSTIKVDTYTSRFVNLGTIKNSALAKYSSPNYTVIEPDATGYIYFAAEVDDEWEEININFGNFSELTNYNFEIKNDENVVYVGTESDEDETLTLTGEVSDITDTIYTFTAAEDNTTYKFIALSSMKDIVVGDSIKLTCYKSDITTETDPYQIENVLSIEEVTEKEEQTTVAIETTTEASTETTTA